MSYKPGSITGGMVTHDCGKTRSIGYFLEGIMPLAPFSKAPFALTLTGITNTEEDVSVRCLLRRQLIIVFTFRFPCASRRLCRWMCYVPWPCRSSSALAWQTTCS